MIARTHDVQRIGRVMLTLTGVLGLGVALVSGPAAAASAVAGGLVAILNLHLIRTAVSRLIAAPHRPLVGITAVLVKLVLVVSLVAAAFSRLPIDPLPFALGVSVLLAAVVLEAMLLGSPIDRRGPDGEHAQ